MNEVILFSSRLEGIVSTSIEKQEEIILPLLTQDIKRIAAKLLHGNLLLDSEKTALNMCVNKKTPYFASFSLGIYKKKLNDVRKNILRMKGNIAHTQLFIQKVASISLTPSSLRALAKLLLVYDGALQPAFLQANVRDKLKNSESELDVFIHAYNRACPAHRHSAGNLAFTVGDYRIFFTKQGILGTPLLDRKLTLPIDIPMEEERWNAQHIDEISEVFFQTYCEVPYNNLSPMLEFMKFFRELKAENPALTLDKAYQAFDPVPVDIFDKYQSGDCVIVSAKIQAVLKERGFFSSVMGTPTRNMWTSPPIPKPKQYGVWAEYNRATEGVFHCQVVTLFSDCEGTQRVAYMNPTFSYQDPLMRRKDFKLFSFTKRVQHLRTDEFEEIINLGHTLKKQMTGKTRMQLLGTRFNGLEQIFGVDFLRGNIYANRAGIKGLQGLPLNSDGHFSISLKEIRRNVTRLYFIDGEEQSLTARDALELFSASAKDRFQLPDDFADNIVTLAENERGIIKKILLSPSRTAKETYNETKLALEILGEVNIQWNEYALMKEQPQVQYFVSSYREKYQQMLFEFEELQEAIVANTPEAVYSAFFEIARIKKEADELKALIALQLIEISKGQEFYELSENSDDSEAWSEYEDSALSDDEGSLSV